MGNWFKSEGDYYNEAWRKAQEDEGKDKSANTAPAFHEVVDSEVERAAEAERKGKEENADFDLLVPAGRERLKRIVEGLGGVGLRFA